MNPKIMLSNIELGNDEDRMALRPQSLCDFVGQTSVCEHLQIAIHAAKQRKEALDHILFYGSPGLGKTTLARILAKEMGGNLRATAGPVITKSGDLASLLTNLQEGDILFIDEIHRLHASIEEILYPAMEDFSLDLMIGSGVAARSVCISLPRFTLVGATTRAGLMTTPLRDRFGLMLHMNFYTDQELTTIVLRQASSLGLNLNYDSALAIATRSRGTPRVAGRLVRRVRDIATLEGQRDISVNTVEDVFSRLNIDPLGLDHIDRLYLQCLAKYYNGGPVGGDTLAASLGYEKDILEDIVEPFLLQKGFIQRSARGRLLTTIGWNHLSKEKKGIKNLFYD